MAKSKPKLAPYYTTAKWDSRDSLTGEVVPEGARIIYVPATRQVYGTAKSIKAMAKELRPAADRESAKPVK